MTEIRKGQAPVVLSRSEFHQRFIESFMDPAFRAEDEAISRVEAIAWGAYTNPMPPAMQQEVRNVANAVGHAVTALRAGKLSQVGRKPSPA